jgi:hypothetical protein
MGGSKPSAPQVIMPAPAAPTVFQSIVPEQSYKDLAAQLGRYEEERGKIEKQKYAEVGTPAEIGARQRARDVKSEMAYMASLPGRRPPTAAPGSYASMDRYKAYTTGVTGGMDTASGTYNEPDTFTRSYDGRSAMTEPTEQFKQPALSLAQTQYADALARVKDTPTPTKTEKPSWADEDLWRGMMEQTKTIKTG